MRNANRSAPYHARASAYFAALGYVPEAARRISECFSILDDAGLLDVLVDGVYFGTDGQKTSGSPVSLQGVTAAALTGTFVRSSKGWTSTQADVAGVSFAISDTPTGTMVVDHASSLTQSSYPAMSPAIVVSSTAQAWSQMWGYGIYTVPRMRSLGASGAFVNDSSYWTVGPNDIDPDPEAWSSRIDAAIYGSIAHKAWSNGRLTTNANSNYAAIQSGKPKTRLSFFRVPTSASAFWDPAPSSEYEYRGTITSGMLFSRVLTDTEAEAATLAARCLRAESVCLVVEGDSTAAIISGATPTQARDNWGYILGQNAGWSSCWRSNVASSGMRVAQMDAVYSNYENQVRRWRPRHTWARSYFAILAGVNDFFIADSAASVAADALLAYVAKARADGFKTLVIAPPPPVNGTWGGYTWTTAKGAKLETYRGLLSAAHAAGLIDHYVDAKTLLPHDGSDASKWRDIIHPNGLGNADIASAIAALIPTP